MRIGWPPDRGARYPFEHRYAGAGRAPDAVQQRQRDSDRDTLFDRQHDDGGGGRDHQRQFAERLPRDRNDLADADDPHRDEQQHAAKGCLWNVTQQRAAEREQSQDDRGSDQHGELRLAAGLSHDRGARRAGIDRKPADQAGEDAADTDADEIAVDIRRLVLVRYERSRRRRGLHHDDDGDDQRQRYQLQPSGDGNVGNDQLRQRAGDIAEHRDAAAFEVEEYHGGGGPDQPDQRAGNADVDPLGDGYQRQHGEADRKREQIGLRQLPGQGRQPLQHRTTGGRQPEYGRQLRDQDVHGNAGQKSHGHRDREQVGDPAEPQNAADDKYEPDHQCEHTGERDII